MPCHVIPSTRVSRETSFALVVLGSPFGTQANILEPVWSAILPVEPGLAVCEAASDAALAFRRVWAVEEGNVLVSYILEPVKVSAWRVRRTDGMSVNSPVQFSLVFKQTQGDTMNGSIAPAFIEEAAGTIQVVEIILVSLAPPEIKIGDLKVGPEMTGAVSVGLVVVIRSPVRVDEPVHGVVVVQMMAMGGEELDGLRPESGD